MPKLNQKENLAGVKQQQQMKTVKSQNYLDMLKDDLGGNCSGHHFDRTPNLLKTNFHMKMPSLLNLKGNSTYK